MHKSVVVSSILVAAVVSLPATADEGARSTLQHRSYRTWTIELPNEVWFPIGSGIAIPHAGGDRFAVELDGSTLMVDTDGDGQTDRAISASEDEFGVRAARVTLSGVHEGGSPFAYGVRLQDVGAGWTWAPGGAMTGLVETENGSAKLQVIDRNGNGRYDDVGEDALIVGRGNVATYLSRTIQIGGSLWALDVDSTGERVELTPYNGATGQLDMTTGLSTKARLVSAVIQSADGQHSFDLAGAEGAMPVPAGTYEIVTGELALGNQSVRVSQGRARSIVAEGDEPVTVEWGGPVEAEFNYMRAGDQVMFTPDAIWFYGDAGEEYRGWNPRGRSPEFKVIDADSGEVLEVLILPGSC